MGLISLRLTAKPAQVADFPVRRALPQRERRLVGPFCFIDHMGPHTAVGLAGGGVGPHPHIGLATVTYLFEGETLHRDSLGTEQVITPGDVNWMSAGSGIVHSERTPKSHVGKQGVMHGLQVWVALPAELEESAPSFQHVSKAALPFSFDEGVGLRVVLGDWLGSRSPVKLASPTVYAMAELLPGAALELPAQYPERGFYVVEGEVGVDGASFTAGEVAVLTPGASGFMTAFTKSRVAVFGGEPLEGPRFMWWNFVSSRKERLAQAKDDWKDRRFALIPGDSEDRIAMPGE
ncbi:MAG: pirin family protein [Archangium sp.]|nr:pirin family protein [Archangium sp.]MDP3571213.1 pirin family protein [Archangium sp.]